MQHRGEILELAVRKSGIPLTRIVSRLGKSRRWLYNQFENPNVALDILYDIGKIIHHDFSKNIPSISALTTAFNSGTDEDPEIYANPQARYWKNKYMALLEDYNEHLKRTSDDKDRK
jgi:hypothetical protein